MPPRANFSRSVPKIEFDPNNPTLTQSELQFAHEVTHNFGNFLSFSAVSAPNFENKCRFSAFFRSLQDHLAKKKEKRKRKTTRLSS